ncbi:uncharacterized protein LOC112553806 [Pomacea canaliculata]|nr:uncharacterized protein LOC112553806 [Pomacea canaliculata]
MSGCSNSVVTTAYLFFHLPLLCCLRLPSSVWPTRQRGRSLGAGGTSRGGSSLSRDDLRDRLSNLGRVFFKDLHLAMLDNRSCSLDNPDELRRLFPGAFLAENDLMRVVPGRGHWTSTSGDRMYAPSRRLVAQRKHADIQAATFSSTPPDGRCGNCVTEIGYEIAEWVVDFAGMNHTVVNFDNAYQFIPSGRCVNENAPCNGGNSGRCLQMSRAHWSLVWTSGRGLGFVAHEVPSHCECLNVGGHQFSSVREQLVSSRGRLAAHGLSLHGGQVRVVDAPPDFWKAVPSPASGTTTQTTATESTRAPE